MHSRFVRRVACVAALLIIGSAAPAPAQQGVLHRLHGTVRDSASGKPLAAASVELPSLGRRAVTDAEGHFEFGALPSAPVTLVARLVGFAPFARLLDLSDGDLATVSPHLTPEVREVLSARGALDARSAFGGTAPARVREQLTDVTAVVDADAAWAGSRPGA